jgi:hypothetical protein
LAQPALLLLPYRLSTSTRFFSPNKDSGVSGGPEWNGLKVGFLRYRLAVGIITSHARTSSRLISSPLSQPQRCLGARHFELQSERQ